MYYRVISTELGNLTLEVCDQGLKAIHWPTALNSESSTPHSPRATKLLDTVERQLLEYFAGTRYSFELPLFPQGTSFQRSVWQALTTIPYGQTRSYGEIAKVLGNPRAMRAVGAANQRNPLPIIVPCHRVIGANGKLIGFSGGLEIKQQLLKLEKSLAETPCLLEFPATTE